MSFRFKPEDFEDLPDVELVRTEEVIAREANRLLDEHVETLPEVFGELIKDGKDINEVGWSETQLDSDRSRARLWDIQEITPAKCEHNNKLQISTAQSLLFWNEAQCSDCGKRLKAKWEPVERPLLGDE